MQQPDARAVAAFILAGLVASVAFAQEPPQRTLRALTVPVARLPEGCRIVQEPPKSERATVVDPISGRLEIPLTGSSFNVRPPFVTTDRREMATIRAWIDGAPRLPDAPPDLREAAMVSERFVEHVVEAYRATYEAGENVRVGVVAIRFDDERRAAEGAPSELVDGYRRVSSRIVRGTIVALVTASARSACFNAIDAYIRALK